MERHRVLDLLPDRTTDTVAAWLKSQPTVKVVSRDRAGAYADAVRQGAPQAQQVADRWHLLQNLTEAVQAVVERQARREHRQARCAEVLRLREQGYSTQSIARQLRMHQRLVRQYLRIGSVPPRTP